jgi:acyl carrier protein
VKKNNEKIIIDIAKKVFEEKKINLNSSVNTIKNWDSVNHVKLIAEIEKKFKGKISLEQSLAIFTLKDILKIVK